MKIGILISGRGSNMVAIAEAVAKGEVPKSEVAVVISNRRDAAGLSRAKEMGLETLLIERNGLSREDHDEKIVAALEAFGVDLVCLAGYMRLLSPFFITRFPNRIINIHPSLLPSFPGVDAVKQAVEYGVKTTGCTVHFVDEHLDHGPIIEQIPITVESGDDEVSLAAKILEAEHAAYISALRRIAVNGLTISGRIVKYSE